MTRRAAFTLIEMLVSLTVTLLMMGAVVTLFSTISNSVSDSRSLIETSERLRHARNVLQADLEGATATMQPPLRPESDEGYFEYIEGPYTDKDWLNFAVTNPNNGYWVIGDTDDVLMFTTRSRSGNFVGKFNGTQSVESPVAEVMYFAVPNGTIIDATTTPPTRLYTLYRRILLVKPGLRNSGSYSLMSSPAPLWYDSFDVSARLETPTSGPPVMVPNSLGDLTKPENRFAHYGLGTTDLDFPFLLNAPIRTGTRPSSSSAYLVPFGIPTAGSGPSRMGDDVLLTNVLAFDVQIYDEGTPIYQNGSQVVTPSDPGYAGGTPIPDVFGAYVDLGYPYAPPAGVSKRPSFNSDPGGTPPRPPQQNGNFAPFAGRRFLSLTDVTPPPPSDGLMPGAKAIQDYPSLGVVQNPLPLAPSGNPSLLCYIYDTWSLHYESDGIQQNSAFSTGDLGTNGVDDHPTDPTAPGNGFVDDFTEYETLAPYPAKMRGIRVTIRVYEPSSQQVREVTVVQDYLPE